MEELLVMALSVFTVVVFMGARVTLEGCVKCRDPFEKLLRMLLTFILVAAGFLFAGTIIHHVAWRIYTMA